MCIRDSVSAGDTTVDIELAPGIVVTMEREGVYKVLENDGAAGSTGSTVRETETDPADGDR